MLVFIVVGFLFVFGFSPKKNLFLFRCLDVTGPFHLKFRPHLYNCSFCTCSDIINCKFSDDFVLVFFFE